MADNWSTANELEFIEVMLTGKFIGYREFHITKEELLRNYIKCAKQRKENGLTRNIDWDECINFAEGYLQEVI